MLLHSYKRFVISGQSQSGAHVYKLSEMSDDHEVAFSFMFY